MHFTGTDSSPLVLLLLKHKKRPPRMEALQLPQRITAEKHSDQINALWCYKEKNTRLTDSQSFERK